MKASKATKTSRFLWFVDGARYGSTNARPSRRGDDAFYVPEFGREARLGAELFEHQTDAMRKAEANLSALASAAGVTPTEMVDRLRQREAAER